MEEGRRGFPTQSRSHSPQRPNMLGKQFSNGYDKNNMSIISLKIASFQMLEKGRRKGKRAEIQTRTWALLEVPPRHPWLKESCLLGQRGSRSSLAEKLWRAQDTKSRSPFLCKKLDFVTAQNPTRLWALPKATQCQPPAATETGPDPAPLVCAFSPGIWEGKPINLSQ